MRGNFLVRFVARGATSCPRIFSVVTFSGVRLPWSNVTQPPSWAIVSQWECFLERLWHRSGYQGGSYAIDPDIPSSILTFLSRRCRLKSYGIRTPSVDRIWRRRPYSKFWFHSLSLILMCHGESPFSEAT